MPLSVRPLIAKIVVLVRTEQQRELLARKVSSLPIDPVKPIQVTFSEETKKRGIDQNAYYWMRLGEISQQAFSNGRQYESDIWHHYLKINEMQEEVELKDGTICSKWLEVPDGSRAVISTTNLSARCFADYITIIEAFGASCGVFFSANPRQEGR